MMDRRRFAKLIAAFFAAPAVAEVAARHPLPLEPDATPVPWPPSPITDEQLADCVVDVGGFLVRDEFAEAIVNANSRAVDRLVRDIDRMVRHA